MMVNNYRIWIINQEATSPDNGALNRHYNLAKALACMGCKPVVFAGSSTRHGSAASSQNGKGYTIDSSGGFPFVRLDTSDYGESKLRRLFEIIKFHMHMDRWSEVFSGEFGDPDVVIGSSPYPTAPALAIRIARRKSAKSICEIRDPWPLDFIVYGVAKKYNPIIIILFALEKYNFRKSDGIIFTLKGGKDYLADRFGRDSALTTELTAKTFYINNGVDLDAFSFNERNYHYSLPENNKRKIIYAGSVRFKNDVGYLLDVARHLKNHADIELVIAGAGGDLERLESRAIKEQLNNVSFLGQIDKKYIPSLLSQADLLFLHSRFQRDIAKYGMSQNKLFDYLASGKPIISDLLPCHSIVNGYECGIEREFSSALECAETILSMLNDSEAMEKWGSNAKRAANDYSFPVLASQLVDSLNSIIA